MTSVTRTYTWSMGHRLQRHEGLCRNPHGHTYEARVTVHGPVQVGDRPDAGMVVDFHAIDRVWDGTCGHWDHAFMLEGDDPFLETLGQFAATLEPGLPPIIVFGVGTPPTAENIAACIGLRMNEHLPKGLVCTRVEVDEGPRATAEWSML